MSFRFHLCGASREVIQSCTASDIHDARNILNPREDLHQFVCSDASLQLGFARPLATDRCVSCGIRPKSQGRETCKRCQTAHRREKESTGENHGGARTRSPEVRAKISVAMKEARRTSPHYGPASKQKARLANIQRGVARRQAKRLSQGA